MTVLASAASATDNYVALSLTAMLVGYLLLALVFPEKF